MSDDNNNESKQPLWFIRHDEGPKGPFPSGAIRRFILLGRVSLEDQVSRDGAQWEVVAQVAEVVPPEVRSAMAEGHLADLLPGQLGEDERTGQERRSWADDAKFKNRRQGERRQPEQKVATRLRKARAELLQLRQRRKMPLSGMAVIGTLVAAVLGYGFYLGAPAPVPDPDCHAAASPGVNWRNCRIDGVSIESAALDGAILNNARLRAARLSAAKLTAADLSYADLSGADLSYAQLKQAKMKGATLRLTDLSYADLREADLSFADMTGANLGGSDLEQARLDHAIWIDGQKCLPGSVGKCIVRRP